MSIFNIFSYSEEKSLAQELARRLEKELPPTVMESRRKILSVNKITRILENIYSKAQSHQKQHRIGFIKRAVLANNFKWELKKLNYPNDFVEMATEGLVIELSKKNNS